MASLPHNEARNAEIVRRRKAGEWPTDIAKAMGLSRNVVIGVCNRAGLCGEWHGTQESPNPIIKLNVEKDREIRRRYWAGETGRTLGEEFGVSQVAISNVCTGKTWAWVA